MSRETKGFMEAAMAMSKTDLIAALESRGIDPDTVTVHPFRKPPYVVTEDGDKILISDLKRKE